MLAVVNVASQIAYPLSSGDTQDLLTIISVLLFFASSIAHCVATRSLGSGFAVVLVCVGGGLAAEAIGWRTGWPFGNYRYGESLGPKLLGVPLVVPLAWAMMGWPALLAGRHASGRGAHGYGAGRAVIGHGVDARAVKNAALADGERAAAVTPKARLITAVVGSLVLTSWDLFLDPQMVDAGHWSWLPTRGPWLNSIPLMNTAGWFFIGMLMIATLDRAVLGSSRLRAGDGLIGVVLGWVWFSEIFGHLVFFGRPRVAVVGGLATTVVGLIVVWGGRNGAHLDSSNSSGKLNTGVVTASSGVVEDSRVL